MFLRKRNESTFQEPQQLGRIKHVKTSLGMFLPRRHRLLICVPFAIVLFWGSRQISSLTVKEFARDRGLSPVESQAGSRFPGQSKRSLVAAGLSNPPTPPRDPPHHMRFSVQISCPEEKSSSLIVMWPMKQKAEETAGQQPSQIALWTSDGFAIRQALTRLPHPN